MLQLRGHCQNVREMLLQDHDQVMEQRDVSVDESWFMSKGMRVRNEERNWVRNGKRGKGRWGEARAVAMEAKKAGRVPPVNAGLGVGNLVETGHPEPVGAPTLSFVHEVTNGQDDL